MKSFNEKSIAAYNKMAYNYDDSPEGQFTLAYKRYLLETMELTGRAAVLDVACGTGSLLKMLSKRADISGYGIDIAGEMVKKAAQSCPQMTFKTAGCEHIPFGDASFDILTVCAAYHHFPDVKAFAKEARRVLKAGGSLYIAEMYLPPLIRILCNPFVPLLLPDGDVRFYSSNQIVHNFEPYGFSSAGVFYKENIQIVRLRKNA